MHTLSACWRQPGLTLREVAWRWLFGIPALLLVVSQVRKVLLAATSGTLDPATLGLDHALLNDPVGALSADPLRAAGKFTSALAQVMPGLEHRALWLVPLLLVVWIVVSSVGRTAVLRCADPATHTRIGTLIALQTIRMGALALVFAFWFLALGWSSRVGVTGPIAQGAEPNLVLFCAMVIIATLLIFTLWGVVSWVLAVAPLLAMLNNTGAAASLAAAARLGALRGKLVEINLVMGIVKIALLVLLMVFSATPLPFEAVTTPEFLAWWWAGVILLYLLWSDFFHVVRLVSYLNLWRTFHTEAQA